ncbi:MAG: carboxymuconolactone decarboxylase family protein [Hyphomicrobiaceae bacterium]
MARIGFVDPDTNPDIAELAGRMSSARRGNLINVYRMLLNSPPLAESWFMHMNAVRWGTTLSGRLRELVIIRIGHLTEAAYVLRQHVPKLAAADGVSEDECWELADWPASKSFTPAERAVLAYTDAVTRTTRAPAGVFEALQSHFDERAILELTVLVATYNMHTRVMNALEIDLEPA